MKIERDGYRLAVFKDNNEPIYVLNSRRIGISQETSINPNYFCCFGQEDVLHNPLWMLAESESGNRDEFFSKLIACINRWNVDILIFKQEEKTDEYRIALLSLIRQRGIRSIIFYNSTEFSDFEAGRRVINNKKKDDLLNIPKDTILYKQLQGKTTNDISGSPQSIENRLYAINALNHVVLSYEYYPFRKPITDKDINKPTEGYK